MPSILRALRDAFVDEPSIRQYVEQRVFDSRVPATVDGSDYVVLRYVSVEPVYVLDGEETIRQSMVQIDVWSESPGRRDEIAEAIRQFLSGKRGYVGNSESSTFIHGATIERLSSIEEQPQDASDQWHFRHSTDYQITHEQLGAPDGQ